LSPAVYEEHILSDPDFPAVYHIGCITRGKPVLTHWHENLEILYVLAGEAEILLDATPVRARPGNLVVTNMNCMHSVSAVSEAFRYHCLIVSENFCNRHGIRIQEAMFAPISDGAPFAESFARMQREMEEKQPYYKQKIQSEIIGILVEVCRRCRVGEDGRAKSGRRLTAVRAAVEYILAHFCEPLTVDSICAGIGYSKYYVCHAFREATGLTLSDFINLQRCRYAGVLLREPGVTVGEVAAAVGFGSASYFSKTYKKFMGEPPSKSSGPMEYMV
jgi:AraC-like DNA-binding protein